MKIQIKMIFLVLTIIISNLTHAELNLNSARGLPKFGSFKSNDLNSFKNYLKKKGHHKNTSYTVEIYCTKKQVKVHGRKRLKTTCKTVDFNTIDS